MERCYDSGSKCRLVYFVRAKDSYRSLNRKTRSRVITIAGLAVIGGAIAFVVILQLQTVHNSDFRNSANAIAVDLINLTQSYQSEEHKWTEKQYSNSTMASVIASYDSRYQQLIDRANALDAPERYKTVKEMLVLSIQTEKESNDHLRTYLLTGDASERQQSIDLLSKSYGYSGDYNAALNAAGG